MNAAQRLADPAQLDDLLLYRLGRLVAVSSTMVVRLCEGRFGITRREWRVMALLAENEGLLSSQLAVSAQLDRARTSRAITSLADKKLLHREPVPGDRRQVCLSLTPQGRALHAEFFPMVAGYNRDLLSGLSTAEVAGLDRLLGELQAKAEQLVAEASLPKADRRRGGRMPRGLA